MRIKYKITKWFTLNMNFAELQSLCRIHFNRNVVFSVRFAKLSTKSCCKTSLWTMCSSRIEFYNEKNGCSFVYKVAKQKDLLQFKDNIHFSNNYLRWGVARFSKYINYFYTRKFLDFFTPCFSDYSSFFFMGRWAEDCYK